MEVTVQVPESSFSALRTTPEKFAREMKLAAVVKCYELGRISQSKGAEMCGVSRSEFLRIRGATRYSMTKTPLIENWNEGKNRHQRIPYHFAPQG